MKAKQGILMVGLLGGGVLLGSALGPRLGAAQTAVLVPAPVAVATDAAGTWVVRGDKVMLCTRKRIQIASVLPPEVECGRPLTLP